MNIDKLITVALAFALGYYFSKSKHEVNEVKVDNYHIGFGDELSSITKSLQDTSKERNGKN